MTSTKHVKTPTRKTGSPDPLSIDGTNDNPAGRQDLGHPSYINSLTAPPLKPSGRVLKPDGSIWHRRNQRQRQWWKTASGRRQKNDTDIKPQQLAGMWEASNTATQLGYPLNTCLNLRWCTANPISMHPLFNFGRDRLRRWCRKNGLPFHLVYVHENPGGTFDKPNAGRLNSHLFIHIPEHLLAEFEDKVRLWFPDAADYPGPDEGIKIDRPLNRLKVLRYMGKGAPQQICRKRGGKRESGGQGYIPFKRIGWSQALG